MTRAAEGSPAAVLLANIEATGRDLRLPLRELLERIGGAPPRPARLVRSIGLDKSLASRLVRAARAESPFEFMHLVPSPTGLRIFSDRAADTVGKEEVARLAGAIDRFQELIDGTPGGRDAIEAIIAESSPDARERREHIAKQASYKSMSFLLGHYCEILTTSLFLVPARNGRTVDGIEVQQRIGMQRLRPSSPVALLSLMTEPDAEPVDDSTWVETLEGGLGNFEPHGFLLGEFSSAPLPEMSVVATGPMTTLMLAGDPGASAPTRLSSAMRIRNGWPLDPGTGRMQIRGYVLHLPSQLVIRNVFLAEELYVGAMPRVMFRLPMPGAPLDDGQGNGHLMPGVIDLNAPIEQLPAGPRAYEIPGVASGRPAIEQALERCGHGRTSFRGWRTTIAYPIPLIEMVWWLSLPGHGS
ncbi:hypothetical protein K8I85_15855 [bacterium]|nr:hypothetical protein [bacterium]